LLWRITGEVRWREYGWTIFKAIESQTKTFSGYASVSTVEQSRSVRTDDMPRYVSAFLVCVCLIADIVPSYFMAETLKYLYLMFLEEDPISLHEWVFNSEAHPLPVIHWTKEEKLKFGINY
jgi:mannosyl-oligosaccharide alpha-1,2-mannosidase